MSAGNIDERIEFLTKNIESLGEHIHELYLTTAEHTKQLEANERETARLRRAMFAALQAYLGGEDGDEQGREHQ